jgi:hypothetical protein
MNSLQWRIQDGNEGACAHGFMYEIIPQEIGTNAKISSMITQDPASGWEITAWRLDPNAAKAFCHLHASGVALAVANGVKQGEKP